MSVKRIVRSLLIIVFVLMVSLVWETMVFAAEKETDEKTIEQNGGGYAASGQLENFGYTAKVYNSTNGLPTSDANYIICADTGYIWLGGYSGILRFDGSVFERLNSSGGLTSGRCLYQDSKDRLWVGTNDNGLICLDHRVRTQYTEKDGLPSRCVRAITEDSQGNIFVGTTAGVAYVDKDLNVIHIKESRLNNGRTMRLTTDSEGGVYGYCDNGYTFYIKNCQLVKILRGTDIGIENITTIIADPEKVGYVYFGVYSGNVYYGEYGKSKNNLKKIEASDELAGAYWLSYECNRVWAASHDTIGYIDEKWKFHVLNDLPINSDIEMLTSDYQGNLWVASTTQGVMKIVSSNFYDITAGTEVNNHQVFVTYIFNNRLYMGTEKGLFILDKHGNEITNKLTEYLGEARIRHITSDSKGNLWICAYSNGLGLVCQKAGGEIINFTYDDGLSSNQTRCVLETADGSFVVGGNSGLSFIKDYKIQSQKDEERVLKNTVVLSLTEIDGDIYVGTDGDGIYILTDRGVRRLTLDNGLTSDIVMRIKWDEFRNVTWLITSNSVQYIKEDVVVNVSSFPYNNCYDLYFDHKDDDVWILASNGIYCVSGQNMVDDNVVYYKHYTLLNGLPSIPTANGYSGIDGEEGEIFVSCRRGVCKFNIDEFVEDEVDIKFDIKTVVCDGVEIFADADGTYTIPAGTARVSFVPGILDYTESNPNVHMSLEGLEDDGVTVQLSDIKPLEYTSLKYGSYTLKIQILSQSGNHIIQEKAFNIVKKPKFFEMLLVQIILIFLFTVVGGLLVWRILSKTIISKQHIELQEARAQMARANSVKDRFLANISDIIRSPLITILGADEMILRRDPSVSSNEYFFSVVNDALDIKKSSEDLLELIDSMLKISKVETGEIKIEEREYDTVTAMRTAVSTTRKLCIDKGLHFNVEVDEKLPAKLYGDIDKISYIIWKMLSNAVKYTANGGVSIRATVLSSDEESCELQISVKDTGIGIKEEYREHILNSFQALGSVPEGIPYDFDLGLSLAEMFANMMGGTLGFESEFEQGAEFTFKFKQKIIDATTAGTFREKDSKVAHGLYIPRFVAPDAEVLIVDGSQKNLSIIKGLLKETKMFVATASTGEECLEKIKFGNFNVVLIDYLLADMDAEELLTRIHEIKPELPVYALSTISTDGEDYYKNKGYAGLLLKPIDSDVMEKVIMSHIPGNIYMKLSDTDGDSEDIMLPEDMEWLYDVEEFNVADGIRESGGAGKYIAALRVFMDGLDTYANGIEDAYRNLDIKLYTVKIHTLRSSFAIVGANVLETKAEALEAAGNRNDLEYVSENTESFLAECRSLYIKLTKMRSIGEEN